MATPNIASRSELDTLSTAELVQDVAYATRVSRQTAEATVDAVCETIRASLAAGMRVELPGLGTFGVHRRGFHFSREFETGAKAMVAFRRVPYFMPDGEFTNRVGDDEAFRRTSLGLTWPPP